MKDIAARLNSIKGAMSVAAFARFLGINQPTLDLYLKGHRKPSVKLIIAVCSKCGCSADELLGLESKAIDPSVAHWKARAVVAERKLERVNKALAHALKGFEELQEAIK